MTNDTELLKQYKVGDVFYHPSFGVKCVVHENKLLDARGNLKIDQTIVAYNGNKKALNEDSLTSILINVAKGHRDAIQQKRQEIDYLTEQFNKTCLRLKKMGMNPVDIESNLATNQISSICDDKPIKKIRSKD